MNTHFRVWVGGPHVPRGLKNRNFYVRVPVRGNRIFTCVYLYYLHIKTKNKKNSKNMKILESAAAGPLPAIASSLRSLRSDAFPTSCVRAAPPRRLLSDPRSCWHPRCRPPDPCSPRAAPPPTPLPSAASEEGRKGRGGELDPSWWDGGGGVGHGAGGLLYGGGRHGIRGGGQGLGGEEKPPRGRGEALRGERESSEEKKR